MHLRVLDSGTAGRPVEACSSDLAAFLALASLAISSCLISTKWSDAVPDRACCPSCAKSIVPATGFFFGEHEWQKQKPAQKCLLTSVSASSAPHPAPRVFEKCVAQIHGFFPSFPPRGGVPHSCARLGGPSRPFQSSGSRQGLEAFAVAALSAAAAVPPDTDRSAGSASGLGGRQLIGLPELRWRSTPSPSKSSSESADPPLVLLPSASWTVKHKRSPAHLDHSDGAGVGVGVRHRPQSNGRVRHD